MLIIKGVNIAKKRYKKKTPRLPELFNGCTPKNNPFLLQLLFNIAIEIYGNYGPSRTEDVLSVSNRL